MSLRLVSVSQWLPSKDEVAARREMRGQSHPVWFNYRESMQTARPD